MATRTMGTTAQTSLTAIQWAHVSDGATSAVGSLLIPADLATMNALVKYDTPPSGGIGPFNDLGNPGAAMPGPFSAIGQNGTLYIPRRGFLKIYEGDFIAIDTQTGWPILVSGSAAANNPAWVHT